MRKEKRDRIEITILVIIAIAGFLYVCNQESKFDKRIEELQKCEPLSYRAIEMDGKKILIPIK